MIAFLTHPDVGLLIVFVAALVIYKHASRERTPRG